MLLLIYSRQDIYSHQEYHQKIKGKKTYRIPENSKSRVLFEEIVFVLPEIFNEIRHSTMELFCGQIFQEMLKAQCMHVNTSTECIQ